MKFEDLKLEFFYLRKAFFQCRQGFKYLNNRYFLVKKILNQPKIWGKPVNNDNLSIHVLTSHRDLVLLIWALASFYRVMEIIGQLFIHSDGSLTPKNKETLNKFFPQAVIIEPSEIEEKYLSAFNNYPLIKEFRTKYPQYFLFKKLIDPYLVSAKPYHLIIDSDLLWFKSPQLIQQEIINGAPHSLMITNNTACYVYFKNKQKVAEEYAWLNSGIVFYHRDNFDLEKLSVYLENIDWTNPENQHFIEQVGYAYCLRNIKKLLPEEYSIQNKVSEKTVARHYTSPKRPWFFIEGLELLKSKLLD